jgi:hypothetical protein
MGHLVDEGLRQAQVAATAGRGIPSGQRDLAGQSATALGGRHPGRGLRRAASSAAVSLAWPAAAADFIRSNAVMRATSTDSSVVGSATNNSSNMCSTVREPSDK